MFFCLWDLSTPDQQAMCPTDHPISHGFSSFSSIPNSPGDFGQITAFFFV